MYHRRPQPPPVAARLMFAGVLLTGCMDGTAILWNIHTGEPILTLREHHRSITQVVISQNGRLLVTANAGGGRVVLWELRLAE
jgi:WD40 repeat protein